MAKGITVPVVQSGLEASIEAAAKKAGPLSLSATVDPSSFKRLAQPLGRVSGLATEFEKSIAASNARVIAFGASVGIINGVQNAFASLVKTTIEVEKSLTNIAVISGKSVDELQPFSRALFEVAKNTAQSFQTASEAALEFSRQGLSLDETLKRTQDALTLTRFTSLSAAEAVDVLTAAANSFGETGITTSEILNKLVAVDTKFAVSAEDLAKGLSRAGSIAQEVGVNFDELNAIVTIAQERTARGGAVIGNAFKTIFTRIRSDETIRALQSVGIYSFDAEGRLKPVVGLLEELAGKINTLSETKRIEVLEAIASKYNINVLTALVDDLGSNASKFREARDVSAGAQNEAYQRQIELNQTLDAIITKVTNSATQLADTLGKIGVTDSLKSLLNFFDNILTGINDVIDSEGIGGTIAKGLISGLSGVFFKIGIPLLLAIFVKLTRDIAQFGAESLKTILGINKEVRERQALEQAVVNTLIKDQQVMTAILSLSGDRRKQEEYLLSVYNRQLAALQQVQSIAAGVAPALQAAGLSATSGTIKKRAAGGYLPAEEAKDVRRGVGGASPSSKVVEIPNFSFGGGKRGTMVANTSEYIVPNYAGGSGTAIFNQDMAKEYGLPPGAKKITASGGFVPASGFVPNFVGQKTEEFKKIAPLSVKEIAIKNSRAAREKDAIFENSDKADDYDTFAANIKILRQDKSNTDYNKLSNKILKNNIFDKFNKTDGKIILPEYESLIKRYKDSGVDSQSISRLTTLVNSAQPGDRQAIVNIKSAIKGIEGEIDASKKLKTKIVSGNRYFDLASGEEVKTRAITPASNILKKVANRFLSEKNIKNRRKNNIEEQATVVLPSDGIISNASRGYIPNFAELNDKGIYAGLVGETAPDNQSDVQRVTKYVTPTEKGLDIYDTGIKSADSVTFDVYRVPRKNEFKLKSIRETLGNTGKNLAIDLAREVTGGALGNNVAEEKLAQTFNPGSLQGFANTIFEASVGALLSDKSFQDYTEQATNSLFDLNIAGNSLIKKNFGIKDSVNALEVKGASTPKLLNSIAEKIYKSTAGGQEAFTQRTRVYIEAPGRANNKKVATAFYKDGVPYVEKQVGVFEPMREGFDASKYEMLKKPKAGAVYRGAALGYVPNFADLFVDYDYTIFGQQLGKAVDFNAEKALIKNIPEDQMTEQERKAREAQMKLLTPFGQKLLQSKKPFKLATARWNDYQPGIESSLRGLGFNVNGVFALGREFSEEQYKVDNPKFAEEMKKPEGERNTRVKPRIEPSAAQKKALFFKERVPQIATGDIDFVDNDPANLQAVKSLMPKINTFTPDQYAAKLLAPQQAKGTKASLGYVPNFVSENAKAAIGRLIREGATSGERAAAEAAKERALKQKSVMSRPLLTLDDENFLETQGGSIEKAMGFGLNPILEKLQSIRNSEELQNSDSAQIKNLKEKIGIVNLQRVWKMIGNQEGKRLQVQKALIEKRYPTRIQGAALGYIPNFAANDPLKEAISREVAAGVSPARVRVTQDSRLRNRDNPDGLAVINTRDEPNGKIPNDFRERGMRAAMAARGFVPNFAEENTGIGVSGLFGKGSNKVDLKNLQDQTTNLIARLKNSEIEIDQFNIELDGLSKKFNELKINALTQLGQKTETAASAAAEATGKYSKALTEKANAIKAEKENQSTGSAKPKEKTKARSTQNNKAEKIDIGKFLLLQSAVVGLTSAFQSVTEQGSAAANTLEGFSSLASGFATFVSLGKTFNPTVRVLLAAGTALASALPLLTRFYESQKSALDRTSESLAKLAEQAEKTGKKISPEEFLAAFDQEIKAAQETKKGETARIQIQKELEKRGAFNESDRNIKAIYSALNALDGISQEGKINQDILRQILRFDYSKGGNLALESTLESAKTAVVQKQVRDARRPQTEDKSRERIEAENKLLQIRFNVTNSIFEKELKITEAYQNRVRLLNDQSVALERVKTILTETEYARRQNAIEVQKIEAETQKSQQDNLNSLRTSFSSLSDKGLGNIFGKLDEGSIKSLVSTFNPQNIQDPKFLSAFQAATKTDENPNGVNFNAILPADREKISEELNNARKKEIQITSERNERLKDANQNLKNFRTEASRLNTETAQLNAIINKAGIQLEGSAESFNGSAKYSELLGLEIEKLSNSFSKQILTNKLLVDSAVERVLNQEGLLNSETDVIEAENMVYDECIKYANVIALARSMKQKLIQSERKADEETSATIEIFSDKYDAEISAIRRRVQLTEAENNLFGNTEDLNNITTDNVAILLKAREVKSKIIKSEKDLEEENQAAISNIKLSYDADVRSTKRKIAYAQALDRVISTTEINEKVTQDLNLESINLKNSIKEAREKFKNIDLVIRNEKQKIESNLLNDLTNRQATGAALEELGIGQNLQAQTESRIITRQLRGRQPEDVSPAEMSDILSGKTRTIQENLSVQRSVLMDEAQTFQQIIGNQTPKLFADGMAEAMGAVLNQADNLRDVLDGVAMNFLKTLQQAFLTQASNRIVAAVLPKAASGGYVKKYADGGLVTGGSGIKDDVPAMLKAGEYVIKKSSVEKYGASNLQKFNFGDAPKFADGGFFLPGVRGGKEISGYKDLTAFAKQTTTSGATDTLMGSKSTAFASLEDQSQRLSAYALLNEEDIINQEIRSAQESALNMIREREAYRTAKRKAFQQQLVGTAVGAAVSFGAGYLGQKASFNLKNPKIPYVREGNVRIGEMRYVPDQESSSQDGPSYWNKKAYGGIIKGYNNGGAPIDKVPALLMDGEYVISQKATRKYGKQFFDSINQGRAPRFADGGQVSTAEPSFAEKAAAMSDSKAAGATNISININVTGESSQMQTEGDTKQKNADYKQMSKQIEQIVLKTIAEQKRAGGMLKPNR